ICSSFSLYRARHLRPLHSFPTRRSSDLFETSPLVVDGVMFLTTASGTIRALDAETGTLLWSYRRQLPRDLSLCCGRMNRGLAIRSEEHTSELQSPCNLVCRLLLEKKKKK